MGENKDKIVVAGGIILIAVVAVFTFVRPSFQKKEEPTIATEKVEPELKDQYPFISLADLEEQLKNKASIVLIDSRSPAEFSQEHVLGSINADNTNIGQYLKTLKSENKLILVGNNSNDLSLKLLAEALKSAGQNNFAILSGGQSGWIKSGGRTVRIGNPNALSDQAKINLLKPEGLKTLIDAKDAQLYILDLRSEKAFSSEHLPQAQNIPGNMLEEKHKSIPVGKKIVFYAGSELETFQLGVMLYDLGISRAQALEGGIEAWKTKGFPVEK